MDGMTRTSAGLLLAIALANAAYGQTNNGNGERKMLRATRTDTPPTIDGLLDEAVWQRAEVVTDFHQIRPGDGSAPTELTELYVLYDDDALYVGARMHDSDPDLIAAPTMRHGQGLGSDDRLVLILDPFNTGRGAYRFETNANGVRHDALYTNISSFQSDWTVIWDAAAQVDETGWLAEIEIPFKTLPFDPESEDWGFNFGRGIRRRGEEVAWVSRNRSYNASILGLATGLSGMDQGVGLDIVPSMAVSRQRSFEGGANTTSGDPSVDLFYRLTPSLNGALTVNTDFSATEVDNRQVNLSRFGLFFPEKRDFFLSDADLFEFGRIAGNGSNSDNQATSRPSRENARPFFSRRLGLSASGMPVDLDYGGKLSGRVGRFSIGSLAIRQDEFEGVDAGNMFVGRVTANVLDESAVGIVVTDGDPRSNLDNSVVGADFRYLNTRLPGGRVLEADAWLQQSDTPGLDGQDRAFGYGVSLPNNSGLRGGFAIKEVEANFNPAMGYVNRSNIRDQALDIGFTHYLQNSFVQSVYGGLDAQRIDVLGGGLQTQVLRARLLEVETNSRDGFELNYIANKEVVAQPFNIYEDNSRQVVIAPGSYAFEETRIGLSTANQRRFSGSVTYQTGNFYNGTRTNVDGSLSWKQSRKFILSLNYDWNDIELPQGQFITRLVGLTTQYSFTPTLAWITLMQYDNVSEQLGVNTRLHWIPTAGQEGFVVLNHNLQDVDKDNAFESSLSELNVKFKYTFRF
jgi:hypothetical protein